MYDLKCYFFVLEQFCDLFTLRPSDLITTFTYVLMDNFCPYFFFILIKTFKLNGEMLLLWTMIKVKQNLGVSVKIF